MEIPSPLGLDTIPFGYYNQIQSRQNSNFPAVFDDCFCNSTRRYHNIFYFFPCIMKFNLSLFSEKFQIFVNQWVIDQSNTPGERAEEEVAPNVMDLFDLIHPLLRNPACSSNLFQHLSSGEIRGIVKAGTYYLQIWTDSSDVQRVILCNTEDRSLVVIEVRDDKSLVEVNDFEGNAITGYGVDCDEKGRKSYEGFLFKGVYVCHGSLYSTRTGCLRYKGCFVNGMRFGHGTPYSSQGVASDERLWFMDKPIKDREEIQLPWVGWNEAVVGTAPNSCNHESVPSLYFTPLLSNLTLIFLSGESFNYVREFSIEGLPKLISMYVGPGTCYARPGTLRIVNCPSFKGFDLRDGAFFRFRHLEMRNLPKLSSVVMSFGNFSYLEELELRGMPFEISHLQSFY